MTERKKEGKRKKKSDLTRKRRQTDKRWERIRIRITEGRKEWQTEKKKDVKRKRRERNKENRKEREWQNEK